MKVTVLHRHRGFTLLEIIVVVAIIVLLVAIGLPMLSVAFKRAKATKTAADLTAISTGLAAYHTDFGVYPRADVPNAGFAVLTKALVGPGPADGPLTPLGSAPYLAGTIASIGTPGPPPATYVEYVAFGQPGNTGGFQTSAAPPTPADWAIFRASDGNTGAGSKARSGGKTYGPYLQPEKFKIRGLAMLDANENPILYFPQRPIRVNETQVGGFVYCVDSQAVPAPAGLPMYDAAENLSFFKRVNDLGRPSATQRMLALLGDYTTDMASSNLDGRIDAAVGEKAVTKAPFLLWTAGADGLFGPATTGTPPAAIQKKDIAKCDDVTQF